MPIVWYELASGRALAQGDLLLGCPVPRVEVYSYPAPAELDVVLDSHHLIVLSQSCDLENNKVDEVLLAAVLDYGVLVDREAAANPSIRGTKWRRAAINGDFPPYSVLPEAIGPPRLNWSLVDFHHLFTLPKRYVEDFAEASGNRLRLVPPYREHLAQAFARYVMRVGLPAPIEGFVNLDLSTLTRRA